jgi:hypothetical protein
VSDGSGPRSPSRASSPSFCKRSGATAPSSPGSPASPLRPGRQQPSFRASGRRSCRDDGQIDLVATVAGLRRTTWVACEASSRRSPSLRRAIRPRNLAHGNDRHQSSVHVLRSRIRGIWAAPSLRSGHALSRGPEAARATKPRDAGLGPSGCDRCRVRLRPMWQEIVLSLLRAPRGSERFRSCRLRPGGRPPPTFYHRPTVLGAVKMLCGLQCGDVAIAA